MRELAHRLVFLDETSVRTGLTRLRGRCPKGERLSGSTPFGRWHSQTFVAGRTCDERIAPWIIPSAMDGDAFDTYVETQLAPVLVPGTVIRRGHSPLDCALLLLIPRQPRDPPQPASRRDFEGQRLLVSVPASLQS